MNELDIKRKIDELQKDAETAIEVVFAELLSEILHKINSLYVKYSKDGMEPSYTDLNKYNRLHNLLLKISETLNGEYKEVVQLIHDHRKMVYVENYLQQAYLFEVYTSLDMGFGIPTTETIVQALANPIEFLTLPKVMEEHRTQIIRKLQIVITQSLLRGEGFYKMAEEIEKAVNFHKHKAILVARTEGGRARSLSDEAVYEQGRKHANITKIWVSARDLRVRISHRKLDFQKADKEGYFHYNGIKAKGPHLWNRADMDIQCRCTTMKLVNGHIPQVMRARNYSDPDYQQRLADRIDKYMEKEGLTYAQAFSKANKRILPPNEVVPFIPYKEWYNKKIA